MAHVTSSQGRVAWLQFTPERSTISIGLDVWMNWINCHDLCKKSPCCGMTSSRGRLNQGLGASPAFQPTRLDGASEDGSVVLDPMGGVGTIAIEVETCWEVVRRMTIVIGIMLVATVCISSCNKYITYIYIYIIYIYTYLITIAVVSVIFSESFRWTWRCIESISEPKNSSLNLPTPFQSI